MRSFLDWLYVATRFAACLSMVSILALVVTQMASRLFSVVAFGVDEFAGYALLATFFLALGPTFKAGSHIRVTLLLRAMPASMARTCDIVSLVIGLGLSLYFAYWSVSLVLESYQFKDVSQGMVKTPLWIPQLSMPVGLIVLVIAFVDDLVMAFVSPRTLDFQHAESRALEAGEV